MAKKVKMKVDGPGRDKSRGPRSNPLKEREDDPRGNAREIVDAVLSDGLMIFLAVMMLPIVLLPTFFDLGPESWGVKNFINAANLVILGIFYFEYYSKLYLAKDRWAHFKNGWHLVDLFVITLPLIELFPMIGITGTHSLLLLRLLRLLRLFAVSGRSMERKTHGEETMASAAPERSTMAISTVDGSLNNVKSGLSLEDVPGYLKDPTQTWIDISGVSEVDIKDLSRVLEIPETLLESKLVEEAYPRIDYMASQSLVFLQAGQIDTPTEGRKYLTIRKHGLLVVCAGQNILTLSRQKAEAFERILENARTRSKGDKVLVVTVLYSVLDYVLQMYRSVVHEIERELIKLENIPSDEKPRDFLARTFELKKEVTRLGSSLHHLKEVVGVITSKRAPLEGFDKSWEDVFDILLDEAGYLYETIENSKENLMSIIELHINMTSYQMNKVMRLIAVITSLTLIPSIIGGLLSMNIIDMPAPVHLWQMVAMTIIMMSTVGWTFYKLGWLKY